MYGKRAPAGSIPHTPSHMYREVERQPNSQQQ
jgi:hypothetical protein